MVLRRWQPEHHRDHGDRDDQQHLRVGAATAPMILRALGLVKAESAAIEATTATLTTAGAVVGATVGRGLGAALLNNDVLAIDDVRVGGESSVVAFNGLILDKGAVLLAVDIKVRKLTMSLESALKITFLDFIRYKLDITESVFLVNGCGRDRLGTLALGVAASSLPAVLGDICRGSLGLGGGCGSLGGGSGNGSRRSSRSSWCSSSSSSGSRAASLALSRRSGRLGQRHYRPGTSGGGSTASPGHGLGRTGRLRRRRLGSRCRLCSRSGGSRAGVRRLLRLLDILLGDSSCSGLGLSRSDLWLGGLGGLGDCLSLNGRGSSLLKLLVNNLGVQLSCIVLRRIHGNRLSRLGNLLGLGFLGESIGIIGLTFLIDVTEDVVQDKVTSGLLGEDEGLNKLLGLLTSAVRDLANDLDNNAVGRSLRVNVGDPDLAVLVVELLDALLDGLMLILA